MKFTSILFALVGAGFCVAAMMNHPEAWAAAALCFFAACMSFIAYRKKTIK